MLQFGYNIMLGTDGSEENKAILVHKLIETLELKKVVIVSPSMSGTFSVPYVTCGRYDDEIVGYIPVAPVIHSSYSEDNFKKLKVCAGTSCISYMLITTYIAA